MFRNLSNYDVFNSWLLEGAEYTDGIELLVLRGTDKVPNDVKLYSFAIGSRVESLDFWPCPYEHDKKFIRIWHNPKRYIPILLRFPGIISPDFSMYRNMPAEMQQWACFMGRSIAHRVEYEGGVVVPNVRWADERSFRYCFDGLPKYSTLSVGSHGCIKTTEDRYWFKRGLSELVIRLEPQTLVVYGAVPDDIFTCIKDAGIRVVQFKSIFAHTHKRGEIAWGPVLDTGYLSAIPGAVRSLAMSRLWIQEMTLFPVFNLGATSTLMVSLMLLPTGPHRTLKSCIMVQKLGSAHELQLR